MPTFFELHELLREAGEDWRDRFGMKPANPVRSGSPSPSTLPIQTHGTAITGRQVEPPPPPLGSRVGVRTDVDPNALKGQMDKTAIRHNVKVPFPTAKIGRSSHGNDFEAINQRDAELNRNVNADKDRDQGPGYLSDPAARILQHVESNPNFLQPGKKYTLAELGAMLEPLMPGMDRRQIASGLITLGKQGQYSPFQHSSEINPLTGKTVHSFVYNQNSKKAELPATGKIASRLNQNPDEDQNALNPYGRQQSPARFGGRADKVGSGKIPALPGDRSFAQPLNMSKERDFGVGTPVDSAVQSFQKAQDELNDILDGKNPHVSPTMARTLLMRMKELHADALHNLKQLRAGGEVDPNKVGEWEQLVQAMGDELKSYPTDLGLTDDKTPEYRPAVKRRRLPYHLAQTQVRNQPPIEPAQEWAYYTA